MRLNRSEQATACIFIASFILLATLIFHQCRQLAIVEAEKHLNNFLLNHRAIHSFVEETQKNEIYRLKKQGALYQEYFSPILLSFTYIARSIKDALNNERINNGLEPIYFKLASRNPRNKINMADDEELNLLESFTNGITKEYKQVINKNENKFLYYAIPIAPNKESCMRCHGNPSSAPAELLQQYGNQYGFNEKIGEIRALISVRVPMNGLLKDANNIAFVISSIALLLLTGMYCSFLYFLRQISFRKKQSEENLYYLNSILQSSNDTAIIATDEKYNIRYFNNSAEQFFGITAAKAMADNLIRIHESISSECGSQFHQAMEHLLTARNYQFRIRCNDRIIETNISAIMSESENFSGYLLLGRDISARIRSEEEKEHLQIQLNQAQKMEAIGTLAGGIAHDFNNILGAIIGFTELARDSIPEESLGAKKLDKVLLASHRAASLVKQILAYSRQVDINAIPIRLSDLVTEAITLIRPSLPSTITIEQQITPPTRPVLADPSQVHQIVMNLCSNAFHAMEQTGGVLKISLRDRSLSQQDLQQHLEIQAGDFVELAISDTGTGVNTEIWGRIFEPYFTTKEVGKGTGMGLSIVHGIITSYGGFITAENNHLGGTIFRVYFPAINQEITPDAAPTGNATSRGNECILLIDDEQMLTEMSQVSLEQLGYSVITRTGALDALTTFQEHPYLYDIVITDQTMPDMTGVDLTRKILQIRPDVPIILCTGYSSLIDEEQAKTLGIKGFIMKPWKKTDMATLLRKTLDECYSPLAPACNDCKTAQDR